MNNKIFWCIAPVPFIFLTASLFFAASLIFLIITIILFIKKSKKKTLIIFSAFTLVLFFSGLIIKVSYKYKIETIFQQEQEQIQRCIQNGGKKETCTPFC